MKLNVVNPWSWQDSFHFSQAVVVRDGRSIVFLAGQTSVDSSGHPLHAGDMRAQLARAFDNVEAVLGQAGLTLANVVRLNYYVTDMAAYPVPETSSPQGLASSPPSHRDACSVLPVCPAPSFWLR
jgi:enamine deaminase RidA (YjgF/YER057c/UK114 family)